MRRRVAARARITATKLIKDQYPEAKIIIVTNFDETDLRESALQAGACGYVLKENLFELRRLLADVPPTNTERIRNEIPEKH
jgi:DNA-binding NarL/FixJ family response regulator